MSIKGFQIDGAVQRYDYTALDNKPVADATLSVSGGFADAAAVGNAIATIRNGGSGLSDGAKQALLALLEKVAYIDENGQTYYDALETALYPPANLVSISAVYTQRLAVYDTASLDDLKADLVVTAHMDDGTTRTATEYTLSGTLAEGTSTITVHYGGKTTTFNVVVSVFSTAPVIAEEDKVWATTGSAAPVLSTATGFGITKTYGFTFSQSNLESSSMYDATNDYMTTNGWSGIKYYISDVNTIADGKSWPSSNRSKHAMFKNDAVISWSSITKNAESKWQFSRNDSNIAHGDGVSFTIPLLDKDNCYAYWFKPLNGSILPDGISEGDIIFAGRNTPYWGCSNISEASS